MKKTKIVCTMGPNANDEGLMRNLVKNGMNIARFNFSHGDYEEHKYRMDMLKKIREEEKIPVAILLDTKGPEIRTGVLKDGKKVMLEAGQEFTLTSEEIIGDQKRVSITYKGLTEDVMPGRKILIDDGLIELEVLRIENHDIVCRIINGGELGEKKGINVPNVPVRLPAITDKDREDIKFGVTQGIDFIAASFVRNAECIIEIRSWLRECNAPYIPIIAKIENAEGIRNIDEIIRSADGIMVARGDMGVEIPFEQIPAIQKELIRKAYNAGKNVITATQMLESMITNARPTRAEITDVANAIYDGSSAIMLSGETAAGKYPVEAVKTMSLIAETTEKDIDYISRFKKRADERNSSITDAISHATVTTAHDLNAVAILTVTKGGTTARTLSKFRPNCPIIALTTDETTYHQLSLSWGIKAGVIEEKTNTDELIRHALERSVELGYLKKGDLVVITAGVPLGMSGTTNLLKVERA